MAEKDDQAAEQFRRQMEEAEAAEAGGSRLERGYREQDPYWGLNRNFTRMVGSLKELSNPGISEEEKKEIRENLPVYYERFMIHLLSDGGKELDDGFLQFENLYPFKTSQGDSILESTLSAVDTSLLEEKWARTKEAEYWLLKTARDTLWVTHNRKLLIGMSGMVNKMYDWEKIMLHVHETYRKDPMTLSYELTFEEKFRGDVLPDKIDERNLSSKEKFSLREKGVRYHADNMFWDMAVAGTGQAEYVNGQRRSMGAFNEEGERFENGEWRGNWVEGLSDREFKFTQLMFGTDKDGNWTNYTEDKWVTYEGRKFPNQILSWQSMGSSQVNKEIYVAIMSELLRRNVRHELEKPEYRDDSGLKALVEDIKRSVNLRRSKLFSPFVPSDKFGQDKYLDLILADNVVKSGIVFDWGHKVAVHRNWQWNYNSKGERTLGAGSATTATDLATGPMWRLFQVESANKNWPYGTMPDTSPEYRKMLSNKRPDYKPTLSDLSPSADITQAERNSGELQNKAFQALKERVMEINPDAWNLYFKNTIWYWETPYKGKEGKNLVLPIWVPPVFESVNFFHTIAWDPKEQVKLKIVDVDPNNPDAGKVLKGGLSLHDALQMGYDLSQKEWSEAEGAKTTDSAYYRHLITIGQLLKILHVMTAKPQLAGQEIQTLLGTSAMLNEWEKRDELGPRDERLPYSIINATLAPLQIMEVTGRIKRGIFTIEGKSSRSLGEWVAGDLEGWRRMIKDTVPEERDGVKGYKDIMLAFFDFYYTQYLLAANRVGLSLTGEERRVETYLTEIAKERVGLKVDYIAPFLQPENPVGK